MQLVAYAFQEHDNKHFELYYFSERKRKYNNLKINWFEIEEPVLNTFLNEYFDIEIVEPNHIIFEKSIESLRKWKEEEKEKIYKTNIERNTINSLVWVD